MFEGEMQTDLNVIVSYFLCLYLGRGLFMCAAVRHNYSIIQSLWQYLVSASIQQQLSDTTQTKCQTNTAM